MWKLGRRCGSVPSGVPLCQRGCRHATDRGAKRRAGEDGWVSARVSHGHRGTVEGACKQRACECD